MNFDKIYNGILENYDLDETFLDDILTTLEFRLKKNNYLYNNILKYSKDGDFEDLDCIYFEAENIIINIRSTLDNLLQLINLVYRLNLNGLDLNIKNVVKRKECSNAVKDIFLLHTHPKNQVWNFIYTTRNEIIHEVCIKTKLPILHDEEYINGEIKNKIIFINKLGNKEDLLYFYKQCIKLINELCDECLYAIHKGLN